MKRSEERGEHDRSEQAGEEGKARPRHADGEHTDDDARAQSALMRRQREDARARSGGRDAWLDVQLV
jgi:hypothetical protein